MTIDVVGTHWWLIFSGYLDKPAQLRERLSQGELMDPNRLLLSVGSSSTQAGQFHIRPESGLHDFAFLDLCPGGLWFQRSYAVSPNRDEGCWAAKPCDVLSVLCLHWLQGAGFSYKQLVDIYFGCSLFGCSSHSSDGFQADHSHQLYRLLSLDGRALFGSMSSSCRYKIQRNRIMIEAEILLPPACSIFHCLWVSTSISILSWTQYYSHLILFLWIWTSWQDERRIVQLIALTALFGRLRLLRSSKRAVHIHRVWPGIPWSVDTRVQQSKGQLCVCEAVLL